MLEFLCSLSDADGLRSLLPGQTHGGIDRVLLVVVRGRGRRRRRGRNSRRGGRGRRPSKRRSPNADQRSDEGEECNETRWERAAHGVRWDGEPARPCLSREFSRRTDAKPGRWPRGPSFRGEREGLAAYVGPSSSSFCALRLRFREEARPYRRPRNHTIQRLLRLRRKRWGSLIPGGGP